ncbi:DUF1203 domain-containing protein [Sphingorhabdus sp. Alg239-R122]|uniref:DUF1203 domain-containing protein n=1 Tax=Sphingorhabdus sp. Alg239-R122 TaxID=2305989 RepID=UPI0013DB1A4B|nr:DUF1203 domain-containing protein [Sphingorhabdus sp. Alg239-R122]
MGYIINGLSPKKFADIADMSDAELAKAHMLRVQSTSQRGFPCRISLQDTPLGEDVILLNYVSHDVTTPYNSSYAIYIRPNVETPSVYLDEIPPIFKGRSLGMRGFGDDGMLKSAALALPGEADAKICELFDNDEIAYIDVHNAAHGCFAARVQRHGS